MLLFIVVGPGLMFTGRKSNKINLKNKSSLINQIFAKAGKLRFKKNIEKRSVFF